MDYIAAQPEDLPATRNTRKGQGHPWDEFAAHLRANAGSWFEVVDHTMSDGAVKVCASRIRNGGLKDFRPAGLYQARQHNGRLWARFVGKDA